MMKNALAFALLLLAPAFTQAQTSVQSHYPQSLRGLKGVRLVVMFGRTGALDEDRKPEILKALQGDAEAKLAKAGIPLLKTGGDLAEAPGSLQLFVTVTLDRSNGHVFPVATQTRLLQKAHLSSDPSVELDLQTWAASSIGDYDISDVESMRR